MTTATTTAFQSLMQTLERDLQSKLDAVTVAMINRAHDYADSPGSEPNEKIIGELTDAEIRLAALRFDCGMKIESLQREYLKYDLRTETPPADLERRGNEATTGYQVTNALLWYSIRTRLNVWDKTVGYRAGWKVVSY